MTTKECVPLEELFKGVQCYFKWTPPLNFYRSFPASTLIEFLAFFRLILNLHLLCLDFDLPSFLLELSSIKVDIYKK